MEDPNKMTRDLKTLRQDMRTSKKHQEMAKIREGFGSGSTKKTFPPDCYYTMIAKILIEDRRIVRVSYLPTYIPAARSSSARQNNKCKQRQERRPV